MHLEALHKLSVVYMLVPAPCLIWFQARAASPRAKSNTSKSEASGRSTGRTGNGHQLGSRIAVFTKSHRVLGHCQKNEMV